MNVGRNLSYQLPACTFRHTDFFLYLIVFWDPRAARERRTAKRDILVGQKTIACLASQEIFKDLSCNLNTNHFSFLSSENIGPLGDLTQ